MLICGVLIMLASNGLRLTFGVFLRPISMDLEVGRQVFGLVIAVQTLLYGVAQPIFGMFADRYGAVKVIIVGAVFYSLGLWLLSLATSAFDLYLSLGVLVGLGLAGNFGSHGVVRRLDPLCLFRFAGKGGGAGCRCRAVVAGGGPRSQGSFGLCPAGPGIFRLRLSRHLHCYTFSGLSGG